MIPPRPTVLLVSQGGQDPLVPRDALDLLQSSGEVRWADWGAEEEEAEYLAHYDHALPEADAILCRPWTPLPVFTPGRWDRALRLKVIAGTFDFRFANWLDVAEAQQRGVTVIDSSRSMTPTVAEFALAMTLNLLRDIPAAIDRVRQGRWKERCWDLPGFVQGDLTGRRVGLVGFGSINRRYAELLGPFRCAVSAYDPFVADDELSRLGVARADSLLDLAAGSEIFVVGIPPTPATLQIIRREVIDALPRGALFVLVTRMTVVEQEALWQRSEAGEIRAAVDVFAPEPPPPDASFRSSPHVLPTPHIAGDTLYCHQRCFRTACEDTLAVLRGEPTRYEVQTRDVKSYEGKPVRAADTATVFAGRAGCP
jgi:phosphoglycerate dehydrogenase-like enzyme